MMNATYTKPDHVDTYVISATHFMFGAEGVKFRSSLSPGCEAPCRAGRVVRVVREFPTPDRPRAAIRRSTVQRATRSSGYIAPSTFHIFRAP